MKNKAETGKIDKATETFLKSVCEQGMARGDLMVEYEEAIPGLEAEYYSYEEVQRPTLPYRYRNWLRREPDKLLSIFDRGFKNIKKWVRNLEGEERCLAQNAVNEIKRSSRCVWIKSYGHNNWYRNTRREALYGWSSFIPYYEKVESHWSTVGVTKNEKGLFDRKFNILRCEGVKLLRKDDLFKMIMHIVPLVDYLSLKEDLEYIERLNLCPHDIELWPVIEGHQLLKVSFCYEPFPFAVPAGVFRDYLSPLLESTMSDKVKSLEQMTLLCGRAMNTIVLAFDLKTGGRGYAFRFAPEGRATKSIKESEFVRWLKKRTKSADQF